MSDLDARCFDAFPAYLRSLGDDARAVARLIDGPALGDAGKRRLAGALNYLFKSLDLIPDGVESLGFMDDAFVFRAAAAAARASAVGEVDATLARLASEAELVREFLGDDYARLDRYVAGLEQGSARGRSVEQVLTDAASRSALVTEVQGWAQAYQAPSFGRDDKNLVNLRSFLAKKLPE